MYNRNSSGSCVAGIPRDDRAQVDYWVQISGDEEAIKCRLALYGPLHVSIYVPPKVGGGTFADLKSGIWQDLDNDCKSSVSTNHAVTLVGYGTEVSQTGVPMDYWLIQNSWGTTRHVDGFLKFQRGVNLCLVGSNALYPVLKTTITKPLVPIYTPTDCEVMKDVFSSTGVYIKSLCIDQYGWSYENGRMNCLKRGMRLYQLDSPEATAGVFNASETNWTKRNFQNILYVYGNSGSECTNINNMDPFGPVTLFNLNAKRISKSCFH